MRSSDSLAARFDPRRNSLNALRLLFATMVVIWHSQAIGFFGKPHGELGSMWGDELAVDGFFIISGFLVTRSRVTTGSGAAYFKKRVLRIYPGYWVCLVVGGFIVGPLLWLHRYHHLSGFPLTAKGGALSYVVTNITLYIHQYGISGLLTHAPVHGSVNGSVWTLMYEFGCYLAVGALAWFGLVRKHSRIMPAVGLVCLLGLLWNTVDPAGFHKAIHSPVIGPNCVRFGLMFAVGATFYLWADRIRVSNRLAVAAAVVFAASLPLSNWRLLGAVPLAYLIMWCAIRLPLHKLGARVDLSYGMYLYAWPVQVLLFTWGVAKLGLTAFTLLSIAGAAACALVSWKFVESPALRLKTRTLGQRRVAVTPAATGDAPANGSSGQAPALVTSAAAAAYLPPGLPEPLPAPPAPVGSTSLAARWQTEISTPPTYLALGDRVTAWLDSPTMLSGRPGLRRVADWLRTVDPEPLAQEPHLPACPACGQWLHAAADCPNGGVLETN